MRPPALLSFVLVALAACNGRDPLDVTRDTGAPIQTDSLRYAFDSRAPARSNISIRFQYTNPSSDTIYVVTCGTHLLPQLQKKQGSTWVPARIVVPPPCITVIAIPPHALQIDALDVCYPTSPTTSSCEPWQAGGVDGVYRLLVTGAHYHTRPDGSSIGPAVPDSLRVSNEFALELK